MNKSKNKAAYAKQMSKDKLPPYLLIVGAVCVVMIIVTIVVTAVMANREPRVEFIPPEFEASAVTGTPEVPDGRGYDRIYKTGMTFSVYICGMVAQTDGAAEVYFTNPEDNDVWLKLRITDSAGNVVGETGLIKPGEYVKSVPLSREFEANESLNVKIMGYEPETYFSKGSVTVSAVIGG